jgi:hypothetical protein
MINSIKNKKKIMKLSKFILLAVILSFSCIANAQETKKYYVVFETQYATARSTINNTNDWKPEVPYKKFVRIVIAPFDGPANMSENGYSSALSNQLAEFVQKNHLDKFKKLKLHLRAFNFSTPMYKERDYNISTSPCDDCNYQHEITIIDGFKFKAAKEFTSNAHTKKMYTFITGKEWGSW